MALRFRQRDVVVSLALLAVLMAVLPPVILAAREAARQKKCENNLKHISLGVLAYSDTFGAFPFGTSGNRALQPAERFSSYLPLWPFFEGKPPKLLVDQSQAWNAEVNRSPKVERIIDWGEPTERTEIYPHPPFPLFGCPSAGRRKMVFGIPVTHYVGTAGLGLQAPAFDLEQPGSGAWGYDRQTKISDVSDGLSTTISLIETNHEPGPWLAGGPSTVRGFDAAAVPYVGQGRQFGGLHSDCPVAMLDGSVRRLANDTDPAAFSALVTIAGAD